MLSGTASVFKVIQAREILVLLGPFLLLKVEKGTLPNHVQDRKLMQWIGPLSLLPAEKNKGNNKTCERFNI